MNKRRLGRTGLEVSELSLGGLFVSSIGADFDGSNAAVRRALESGINYIDTAPTYGDSERVLGRILRDVPASEFPVLSTKIGGRPTPFDPQSIDCLQRALESSLDALGVESIDILYVHEPDRPGQYDWWTDFAAAKGPVLDLLHDWKRQGLVKHIGLGGTTVYELATLIKTGHFDVVLTAYNYSLLWREAAGEIFPAAMERDVGIAVGSPLQQGVFGQKHESATADSTYWLSSVRKAQFKRLYKLVDECGIPLPELALRFVLSNPDVGCVLTGSRSAAEVDQNIKATLDGALPPQLLSAIDEIAASVPFRPFLEPPALGWFMSDPAAYKGPGQ